MAKERTVRKLLQNTLFAAMTAWALYGVQAQMLDDAPAAVSGGRTSSGVPGRF